MPTQNGVWRDDGADASELSPQRHNELRMQAIDWLREELSAWQRRVAKDEAVRPDAIKRLRHAQQSDPDLAGIRDPKSLEKLSARERAACVALWEEYQRVLQELQKVR